MIEVVSLALAIAYANRLRRMDTLTHGWACIVAQAIGGVAPCLLALASLSDLAPASDAALALVCNAAHFFATRGALLEHSGSR